MNTPSPFTLHLRRGVVYATVAALHLGALPSVWAAPAQIPLIPSTGALPKPNMMLTIDTSGSMNFRHMPENQTTANGYTVTVKGSETWLHHPLDTYEDGKDQSNYLFAGNIGGTTGTNDVEQMKLRSPDVNSIYYNPKVRYRPWAKADGTRYPDAVITGAFVDPTKQGTSDTKINLSATSYCSRYFGNTCIQTTNFNAGLYYLLRSSTVDPTRAASYTEYNINASGSPTFTKYADRTDCAGSTCTQAEERKNFAQWFVYYRTRMLLTRAALTEAFVNMGEVANVGWTTIKYANDNRVSASRPRNSVMQGVRPLTTAHRTNLINTLQSSTFDANGGTPLRIALNEVGKYFQDNSNNGPWSDDPVNGSSSRSSCRRSYNLLTTDGYYNDSISSTDAVGDLDGSTTVTNYTRARPYRDRASGTGYSNTLADYALKYWAADLSTAANNIIPTSKDPATWQHLTQFTVGMGVTGSLDHTAPSTLERLTSGTINWPNPADADRYKIDDLWHAAVNSRGEFYSVKSYSELATAVKNAIGKAVYQDLREGGATTAVKTLSSGNFKYVPQYQSGSWTGEVFAYGIDNLGRTTSDTPVWRASQQMPAWASRNIVIQNPNNSAGQRTVAFTWATMGALNQAAMGSSQSSLVDYIRGDDTNESSTGFRVRSSLLPDFINSNIVHVKNDVNVAYTSSDFLTFQALKANRQGTVYVGGNGGMLHGFNASTGAETFGFVPRGVLGNLTQLAAQDYGMPGTNEHRYYVDGPMVEADAVIGGVWRNLLVGTLGAGGKGLYALSLPVRSTDPSTPQVQFDLTAASAANTTLNANLGYITAPAQVGQLPNGQWKVFVGNGAESSDGRASLIMIDLADGSMQVIYTDAQTSNGLGGVTLMRNSLKQVVAVYAGDLRGRLWRFEYNGSNMVVGYGGNPLFTATTAQGTAQPITAEPATVTQTTTGNMVLFGTGKLFTTADKTDRSMQSIYGVWDKTPSDQSTATLTSPFGTHSTAQLHRRYLVAQTITAYPGRTDYFNVSSEPQTSTSLGWVLDLAFPNGDRSRVIYPVQVYNSTAFIDTVMPAGTAAECQALAGSGYGFVLPARTGAQKSIPTIDTNGDGLVNANDIIAAGYQSRPDGRDAIVPQAQTPGGGDDKQLCSVQTAWGSQLAECDEDDPPGEVTKTIKSRIWRRLTPLQPD